MFIMARISNSFSGIKTGKELKSKSFPHIGLLLFCILFSPTALKTYREVTFHVP